MAVVVAVLGSQPCLRAQESVITSFSGNGTLAWTSAVPNTLCHVEWASTLTSGWSRSWSALQGVVATGTVTQVAVPMFYRVVSVSNAPSDSLIAYYPLDGNLIDYSGNANNGTPVGVSFTTDRHGHQGHAMIVYYPHAAFLPSAVFSSLTDFSITAWIKLETLWGINHALSVANAVTDNELTISYVPASDFFRCFVRNTIVTFASASAVEDLGWHHLAFTRNGTTAALYLDGSLYPASGAVPGSALVVAEGGVVIGEDQDSIGGGFETSQSLAGRIDELRIYSRALSSNEVRTAYDLSR